MTIRSRVKIFLTLLVTLTLTLVARAATNMDRSQVQEIQRQWGYLDRLKAVKDKALKKKSHRLLLAIENHFYANSVKFEVDPQDSAGLLLQVLPMAELKNSNALNRFATSLFQKYQGLRVDINPLKLKLDDAGALFDEETNRLTLAFDNVIELKTDSFVGHELIHARFYQYEKKGEEHVFMGWLKRQDATPVMQETYPDAFSLDELAAYYYQVLTLLYEARLEARDSATHKMNLETAKNFVEIGLQLVGYLTSDEISQFAQTYLQDPQSHQVTFDKDKTHDIVRIETKKYILDLNFAHKENRSVEELRQLALKRIVELHDRMKLISEKFTQAHEAIEKADGDKAIEILSSGRDQVLRK